MQSQKPREIRPCLKAIDVNLVLQQESSWPLIIHRHGYCQGGQQVRAGGPAGKAERGSVNPLEKRVMEPVFRINSLQRKLLRDGASGPSVPGSPADLRQALGLPKLVSLNEWGGEHDL